MFAFTFLFTLTLILILLYQYSTRNFNYWKNKGVPYPKPLPLVGNIIDVFTFRSTIGLYLAKLYNEFQTPFFGIYVLNQPCLVIKDRELIKSILMTDFNVFCDRNVLSDEGCDPIAANTMGIIKNPAWKSLRTKVSPIFSIAKIKNMMKSIIDVTEEMITFISSNLDKDHFELKEISSKFTVDVTATCLFGVKTHCFANEDAELYKIAKLMFDFNWRNGFNQASYLMAPHLAKLLKLPFFDPKVNEYMRNATWATLEERVKSNVKRNDLIDVVLQLKNGNMPEDDYQFVGDRVVAQPLTFLSAGFETTSSALSFIMYNLCINTEVQDKLRKEIQEVLADDKEITYETLQQMKYMDMVISETLRMYPPLPFLDRTCRRNYTLPHTNIVIEKGTPIFIPTFGMHWDPEIFPNPEKFDPDRFADKNNEKLCYMPFGLGPRACIGAKLAMIEMKIALTRILSEFEVKRCSKTPEPIQFETKCSFLGSKVGFPVKFTKLSY